MPVNLNLLPSELSVSKNLNSFLKTLRALGVIGVAAFLVFALGLGVFFIVSTISLNGINANVTKLRSQVSALQKSEQQIILLKDRIAKIASIKTMPNSLPGLTAIKPFLSDLSDNSSINEMSISPTAITLSENIKTKADISSFIKSFQSSDVFKSVSLTSFNFNPSNGYSVEISAVIK